MDLRAGAGSANRKRQEAFMEMPTDDEEEEEEMEGEVRGVRRDPCDMCGSPPPRST